MDKQCKSCLKTLDISNFYKHPLNADGYQGKCKECVKSGVLANRAKNLDTIREYDRERGKSAKRKAKTVEYNRKYRKAFPKRAKANRMINYRIRKGTLTPRPCEVCQAAKTVAHHDDYNFPLQIRWLCQPCHKDWHKNNQVID